MVLLAYLNFEVAHSFIELRLGTEVGLNDKVLTYLFACPCSLIWALSMWPSAKLDPWINGIDLYHIVVDLNMLFGWSARIESQFRRHDDDLLSAHRLSTVRYHAQLWV